MHTSTMLWLTLCLATGCKSELGQGGTADDRDNDGFTWDVDCHDGLAHVYPGAPELCNGADDDCDGEIDEAGDLAESAPTFYADVDGDGAGDAATAIRACSRPDGYAVDSGDCDDTDNEIGRGGQETCNGIDDDCDGEIDEGHGPATHAWYLDVDGDGHGSPGHVSRGCEAPDNHVQAGDDCRDTDPEAHPGADERCNSFDDDCDGLVDEDLPRSDWWGDADGDGWGAGSAVSRCDAPTGLWASTGGDCDDTEPDRSPGALERCNSIDDDCDGEVDEGESSDGLLWFADNDGDGFGDPAVERRTCSSLGGWVADDGDCDDNDDTIRPGADELCDGIDRDCNGTPDDNPVDGTPWFHDRDGDGHAGAISPTWTCADPGNLSATSPDCDDTNPAVSPEGTEACNAIDDDCDGDIDEAGATGATTFFADSDQDGFGATAGATLQACTAPDGYAASADDCDDNAGTVHPGAIELCGGADDDCDGEVDEDALDALVWYRDDDGDGYGGDSPHQRACAQPSGWVRWGGDCDELETRPAFLKRRPRRGAAGRRDC